MNRNVPTTTVFGFTPVGCRPRELALVRNCQTPFINANVRPFARSQFTDPQSRAGKRDDDIVKPNQCRRCPTVVDDRDNLKIGVAIGPLVVSLVELECQRLVCRRREWLQMLALVLRGTKRECRRFVRPVCSRDCEAIVNGRFELLWGG